MPWPGRRIALVMLSGTGLVPVSQALAGIVSSWNLTLLFVGPGALVLLLVGWLMTRPAFHALGAQIASPAEAPTLLRYSHEPQRDPATARLSDGAGKTGQ